MILIAKFLEDWRNTLFVVCLAGVIEQHIPGFNALNSYAFLVASNLEYNYGKGDPNSSEIKVVLIDQETFNNKYFERSPIDRCMFKKDIEKIYAAHPKSLAIDFNLSPLVHIPDNLDSQTLKAELERQRKCEESLYELLAEKNGGTKTVLITPLPVDMFSEGTTCSKLIPEKCLAQDKQSSNAQAEDAEGWQKRLECKGINFGLDTLSISYGIVERSQSKLPTLSRCVKYLDSTTNQVQSNNDWINPKTYKNIQEITLSELGNDLSYLKGKVVFFGAGYGGDDIHLTPVGDKFGVIIHAASYLSLSKPLLDIDSGVVSDSANRVSKFLNSVVSIIINFIFGVMFGQTVGYCLAKYFHERISEGDIRHSKIAYRWILALLVVFVVDLVLVCILAIYFLLIWDIWLSPVTIGIAMLLEEVLVGYVEHVEHHLAKGLAIENHETPNSQAPTYFIWVWLRQFQLVLLEISVFYRVGIIGFMQLVWRGFHQDLKFTFYNSLRRCIWIGVIGLYCYQTFF